MWFRHELFIVISDTKQIHWSVDLIQRYNVELFSNLYSFCALDPLRLSTVWFTTSSVLLRGQMQQPKGLALSNWVLNSLYWIITKLPSFHKFHELNSHSIRALLAQKGLSRFISLANRTIHFLNHLPEAISTVQILVTQAFFTSFLSWYNPHPCRKPSELEWNSQ